MPDTVDIGALSAEGHDPLVEINDPCSLRRDNAPTRRDIVGCAPLMTN